MESGNPKHSAKTSQELRSRIRQRRGEIVVACILTFAALAYLGVTAWRYNTMMDGATMNHRSQSGITETRR